MKKIYIIMAIALLSAVSVKADTQMVGTYQWVSTAGGYQYDGSSDSWDSVDASDDSSGVSAFRAYIVSTDVSSSNVVTALEQVMRDDSIFGEGDGFYYNMQGQRVSDNPAPGIYIRNHKKVIVR